MGSHISSDQIIPPFLLYLLYLTSTNKAYIGEGAERYILPLPPTLWPPMGVTTLHLGTTGRENEETNESVDVDLDNDKLILSFTQKRHFHL